MLGAVAVLAHQGGWDEALLVLTPVALFVVLYRVAVARAERGDGSDDGPPRR